jgi:hypothetical protein
LPSSYKLHTAAVMDANTTTELHATTDLHAGTSASTITILMNSAGTVSLASPLR